MIKKILSIILMIMVVSYTYAEDGHNHDSQKKRDARSMKKSHDHKKGGDDQHDHDHDHDHGKKEGDSHSSKKHKKGDKHDHGKKKGDGHADEEHDHGSSDSGHGSGKSIGKGKAIEEVDEVKGFRLSKEAIKTLKLKLQTVNGSSFKISKKTLVASKDKKGVYRFRAGYFKFLPAKAIKEVKGGYSVNVKGVTFGDQIVSDGLGLLRVADVYSTDKSEYGHSH